VVLFSDIAGSTALYERIGNRAAFERISACIARLDAATRQAGGRVVKTIGDAVMCTFGDTGVAVRVATDMQLGQQQAAAGELGLRIGFHVGDVIERDSDMYGDSVNVAARVSALARHGQILTTEAVYSSLPPYLRAGMRPLGAVTLRGKGQPLELFEVIWSWAGNLTMANAGCGEEHGGTQLILQYQGVARQMDELSGALCFGRDTGNDIVVALPRTSRLHGRIEARRSGFVLADLSTNGTYLSQAGGPEILLRREEALLQGHGAIGPGESASTAPQAAISFRCRQLLPAGK
jgi:hypothetical protein